MTCIFCGAAGLTKEHVIPRWTGIVLSGSQHDFGGHPPPPAARIMHLYEPPPGASVVARNWSKGNPDLQVGAVCGSCNSGWMNGLEGAARPILTELIQGRRLNPDSNDQASLAAWTFKTELMFQQARPRTVRCIGDGRYSAFYAARVPPVDVSVWMGATSGGPAVFELATEATLGFGGEQTTPGFVAVLAFGNLLLILAGPQDHDADLKAIETRTEPSVLQRIWPLRHESILWGPSVVIDGRELANAPQLISPKNTDRAIAL